MAVRHLKSIRPWWFPQVLTQTPLLSDLYDVTDLEKRVDIVNIISVYNPSHLLFVTLDRAQRYKDICT